MKVKVHQFVLSPSEMIYTTVTQWDDLHNSHIVRYRLKRHPVRWSTQNFPSELIHTTVTQWYDPCNSYPVRWSTQQSPIETIYSTVTQWHDLHNSHRVRWYTQCSPSEMIYTIVTQWDDLHNSHPVIWNRIRPRAPVYNQWIKGNNSARQTRDTTTKTWIVYGGFTWHATKYKAYKLHQRYILEDTQ